MKSDSKRVFAWGALAAPGFIAGPGTLVEVLEVAGDLYAAAICNVFDLRNIPHPDPPPNVCQESAGRSCYGDCDSNGVLDIFDFLCFQNAFVGGCP